MNTKEVEEELKMQMLLIMASVQWLDKKVSKIIDEIKREEKIIKYNEKNFINYNYDKLEKLDGELRNLYKRLCQESENIKILMAKYPNYFKNGKFIKNKKQK